jgi:parvulin-like peptidyl-prolyl isomerase
VKITNLLIAATVFGAMTLTTVIAQKAAKAPAPTTRPASKVVATIGKVSITSDRLKTAMQRMRTNSKAQALDQLITQELIEAYVRAVPCTDKDIDAWKTKMTAELKASKQGTLEEFMAKRKIPKEEIPQIVRFEKLNKLAMDAASADAISAFTKANPTYFDGTEVQASHILMSCGPGAGTTQRAEIRKQLEQIASDIKADKVKFADAAKKHSKCPSGAKGGDLGSFAFHRMVTPFSQTAFGMKVGDVSGIVETQFGFHIIKVTKQTAGSGKVGPNAQQIAKQTLLGNFRDKIVAEARKSNPVTIVQ